jgi:NAD(P)-dependent dehydrogenase (short-subunit alcohol dehydrogenase family)
MSIAVVVGATGGIGAALLAQLSADPAFTKVIALSRHRPPGQTADHWIEADILEEDSLRQAAEALRPQGPLTRVIVATGRLAMPGGAPEKSLRSLALQPMLDLFAINAAGPALVARHLLPLTPREQPSVFAALSARVGSIGDNQLGGWYSYRASKAALNMLIHTIAIEHRRTRPLGICVALHPGTVDTSLSQPFQANVPASRLHTPSQAASGLLKVMQDLTPEQTGNFYAWDGSPIPW